MELSACLQLAFYHYHCCSTCSFIMSYAEHVSIRRIIMHELRNHGQWGHYSHKCFHLQQRFLSFCFILLELNTSFLILPLVNPFRIRNPMKTVRSLFSSNFISSFWLPNLFVSIFFPDMTNWIFTLAVWHRLLILHCQISNGSITTLFDHNDMSLLQGSKAHHCI